MSSEDTTILKIQYQTSDRVFYTDLECSIEKTDGCKNNSKIHLQQKKMNILHQVFQCLQHRHLKA